MNNTTWIPDISSVGILFINEDDNTMTKTKYIFYIAIKRVLNFIIHLVTTVLNTSTILVICKNNILQKPSNALVVCFSIEHSLGVIVGTLTLITDYALDNNTKSWRISCSFQNFVSTYQQCTNYISIMAISIERVYSVYFPLQTYKTKFPMNDEVHCTCTVLCIDNNNCRFNHGVLYGEFYRYVNLHWTNSLRKTR